MLLRVVRLFGLLTSRSIFEDKFNIRNVIDIWWDFVTRWNLASLREIINWSPIQGSITLKITTYTFSCFLVFPLYEHKSQAKFFSELWVLKCSWSSLIFLAMKKHPTSGHLHSLPPWVSMCCWRVNLELWNFAERTKTPQLLCSTFSWVKKGNYTNFSF